VVRTPERKEHTVRTVTIQTEAPLGDFMSHLLGSAFETWSWWHEVTYAEGYDWETFPDDLDQPYLTLGIEDPNGEEDEEGFMPSITKTFSVNDLVKAYGEMPHKYRRQWDDHDASSADCVLQYAVLGEVTYA
jgi:hypothetical protein